MQVMLEAEQVFGSAEQTPSRDAVEGMQYTVACLKVGAIPDSLLHAATDACSFCAMGAMHPHVI